jgi:hypothetical protein
MSPMRQLVSVSSKLKRPPPLSRNRFCRLGRDPTRLMLRWGKPGVNVIVTHAVVGHSRSERLKTPPFASRVRASAESTGARPVLETGPLVQPVASAPVCPGALPAGRHAVPFVRE